MPSIREKHNKQVGEEILELLSKPTAKERSLAEKFKSQGGAQVMEFCPHGTRVDCLRAQQDTEELQSSVKKADDPTVLIKLEENVEPVVVASDSIKCNKLHFKKIIQAHTDESLVNECWTILTTKIFDKRNPFQVGRLQFSEHLFSHGLMQVSFSTVDRNVSQLIFTVARQIRSLRSGHPVVFRRV